MSASTFRAMRLLAVLVLSGCLGSCGDSPTAPSLHTLSGTWVSSDRSFTWILAQSGTTVTGTHVSTDGEPPVAINGVLSGREFSFRVVTGEQVQTFLLDVPRVVELGWAARVDVNGDRMTGSISPLYSPFRYYFREITLRRVHTSR
jgi:hypothetical protein